MLISITNMQATNAVFNTRTGKTITLASGQVAVVKCDAADFKYYLPLTRAGFALNTDDSIIIVPASSNIVTEKIKEVEKIVEVPVTVIREVIKEVPVVKEVPVERIVEVEKPVEKVVEIIKEVPIERKQVLCEETPAVAETIVEEVTDDSVAEPEIVGDSQDTKEAVSNVKPVQTTTKTANKTVASTAKK